MAIPAETHALHREIAHVISLVPSILIFPSSIFAPLLRNCCTPITAHPYLYPNFRVTIAKWNLFPRIERVEFEPHDCCGKLTPFPERAWGQAWLECFSSCFFARSCETSNAVFDAYKYFPDILHPQKSELVCLRSRSYYTEASEFILLPALFSLSLYFIICILHRDKISCARELCIYNCWHH